MTIGVRFVDGAPRARRQQDRNVPSRWRALPTAWNLRRDRGAAGHPNQNKWRTAPSFVHTAPVQSRFPRPCSRRRQHGIASAAPGLRPVDGSRTAQSTERRVPRTVDEKVPEPCATRSSCCPGTVPCRDKAVINALCPPFGRGSDNVGHGHPRPNVKTRSLTSRNRWRWPRAASAMNRVVPQGPGRSAAARGGGWVLKLIDDFVAPKFHPSRGSRRP